MSAAVATASSTEDQPIAAGVPADLPLKDIRTPHPHDVLCGRGGGTNNHIGNNHWRTLVAANKRLYIMVAKRQKMLVAMSIVRAVRSQNPPGRFLKRDETTGYWSDIGDAGAQEKTSQALREGAPDIRNEIERERQAVAQGGTAQGAAAAAAGMMPPMAAAAAAAAYGQIPMPPMGFPYPGMPGGPGAIPPQMMYGGMPPSMYGHPFVMPPGAPPYPPMGYPGLPPPQAMPPGAWPGGPGGSATMSAAMKPPVPASAPSVPSDKSAFEKETPKNGETPAAKESTSKEAPKEAEASQRLTNGKDQVPQPAKETSTEETKDDDPVDEEEDGDEDDEAGAEAPPPLDTGGSDRVIPVPTRVSSTTSQEMPPPPRPPGGAIPDRQLSDAMQSHTTIKEEDDGDENKDDLLSPRRIVVVAGMPVGFEGDDLLADNFEEPPEEEEEESVVPEGAELSDTDWSNFKALVEANSRFTADFSAQIGNEDPLRPLASNGKNVPAPPERVGSGSSDVVVLSATPARETSLDRDYSNFSMMSFSAGGISRQVSRAGSTISLDIDPDTVAALMRDVSNALSEMSISRGASLASNMPGGSGGGVSQDGLPPGSLGPLGVERETSDLGQGDELTDLNRGGTNTSNRSEISELSASVFARGTSEE